MNSGKIHPMTHTSTQTNSPDSIVINLLISPTSHFSSPALSLRVKMHSVCLLSKLQHDTRPQLLHLLCIHTEQPENRFPHSKQRGGEKQRMFVSGIAWSSKCPCLHPLSHSYWEMPKNRCVTVINYCSRMQKQLLCISMTSQCQYYFLRFYLSDRVDWKCTSRPHLEITLVCW